MQFCNNLPNTHTHRQIRELWEQTECLMHLHHFMFYALFFMYSFCPVRFLREKNGSLIPPTLQSSGTYVEGH